jgi:hypothetical protein
MSVVENPESLMKEYQSTQDMVRHYDGWLDRVKGPRLSSGYPRFCFSYCTALFQVVKLV